MKKLRTALFGKKTSWLVVGLVVASLVVGSFLRLYNLPDSLQFLGDQGRDALIVSKIFTEGDLVFIGPVTSVGNMYLGPLYYYFMMPFLWLSYPSPMGPVYAVAVLSCLTIALVFVLGRKMVGPVPAALGTLLFTFSSVAIEYGRFSWNPNPAPLVGLLMAFWTYLAWTKSRWYWVAVGAAFAVLLQLHYLTLLAAGGAGLVWLIQLFEDVSPNFKKKKLRWGAEAKQLLLASVLAGAVVIMSFTPIFLFEYKHDFPIYRARTGQVLIGDNFKQASDETLPQKVASTVKESHGRGMHIMFEMYIGQTRWLNTALLVVVVISVIWLLTQKDKYEHWHGLVVLVSYVGVAIAGTSLYENSVFHHYVLYVMPMAVLILGAVMELISRHKLGLVGSSAYVAYFMWFNLTHLPIQDMGWKISDMQAVADTIYERVDENETYGVVLLTGTGDIRGENYRYFLSTTDKPAQSFENPEIPDKLFIINEDRVLDKVTDSPIYQIVVFPNKEPVEVYTAADGPEITVLQQSNQVE